jgi:sigma-B regulation protein RsbU (phosphoserine phosphatase)
VQAGDLLVLFSDGVTEARNPAGDEFGDDRLAAALNRVRTQPAQAVLDAVHKDLLAFRQSIPAEDDVTIMAVRFR